MNVSDIIALAKAGFTAEQIGALATVPVELTPAPAAPAETVTPPAPAPTEPVTPPAPPAADPLSAVLAEMAALKKVVQQQNVRGAELIPPQPETAEEVLAKLIAPPAKPGDNK